MSEVSVGNELEKLIENHPHIILFDGVCNLCSGWVKFLIQRDPQARFSFCSVQSPEGKVLLEYCGLPTDSIETMAYIQHGQVFIKSTGCLEVLKILSAPWRWLAVLSVVPNGIRDWFYSQIARNRYKIWGKSSQCMIPSSDTLGRFI